MGDHFTLGISIGVNYQDLLSPSLTTQLIVRYVPLTTVLTLDGGSGS